METNKKIKASGGGLRLLLKTVGIACLMAVCYTMVLPAAECCVKNIYSSEFEKAVTVIKKYEGLHKNQGNLVGYGHKILASDPYKRNQTLSEEEADKLLRSDLQKLCAKYREFGKDSLLLSALAYNCGIGVVAKSSVYRNIKNGNRDESDIKASYLAHSRYRGKTLSQLKRRRAEEFETLYIP